MDEPQCYGRILWLESNNTYFKCLLFIKPKPIKFIVCNRILNNGISLERLIT